PKLKDLSSLCVAASTISTLPASFELGPPPNPEIKTNFPSGVNFNRFARFTEIGIVCVAFLFATSMIVTVPSAAFAAQISLPSGDTSKPSTPFPAGTFVTRQVFRGPAPGGIPGGGPPGPPPEPGGGPNVGPS